MLCDQDLILVGNISLERDEEDSKSWSIRVDGKIIDAGDLDYVIWCIGEWTKEGPEEERVAFAALLQAIPAWREKLDYV